MIKVETDATKVIALQVQSNIGVWLTPTESKDQWYDVAAVVSRWGAGFCQRDNIEWRTMGKTVESTGGGLVTVHVYYCPICNHLVARTHYKGGQQYWDNLQGTGGHLPSLITFGKGTFDGCVDTPPVIASHENFVGMYLSGACLVGMAPYTLDMLTCMFVNGTGYQAVCRYLHAAGMLNISAWNTMPHRIASQGDWLVIDTIAQPLNTMGTFEMWIKSMQNRWSTKAKDNFRYASTTQARTLFEGIKAALKTPVHNAEFMRALTGLGWTTRFKSEDWEKRVGEVLSPFGEPSKVLTPKKTLRARG